MRLLLIKSFLIAIILTLGNFSLADDKQSTKSILESLSKQQKEQSDYKNNLKRLNENSETQAESEKIDFQKYLPYINVNRIDPDWEYNEYHPGF